MPVSSCHHVLNLCTPATPVGCYLGPTGTANPVGFTCPGCGSAQGQRNDRASWPACQSSQKQCAKTLQVTQTLRSCKTEESTTLSPMQVAECCSRFKDQKQYAILGLRDLSTAAHRALDPSGSGLRSGFRRTSELSGSSPNERSLTDKVFFRLPLMQPRPACCCWEGWASLGVSKHSEEKHILKQTPLSRPPLGSGNSGKEETESPQSGVFDWQPARPTCGNTVWRTELPTKTGSRIPRPGRCGSDVKVLRH